LDVALAETLAEIVFVDDSTDDTPDRIRETGNTIPRNVLLLHRQPGAQDGGLSGAVMAGFAMAQASWLVVMDGDLQHPPEMVHALVAKAEEAGADIAVASRYVEDGDAGGLANPTRVAVSGVATRLTKSLFPRALAGVSDPMSGFFAVRSDAIDLNDLRPHGFKILLEILVRNPRLRVITVPFSMGRRWTGTSKASVAEGIRFARHITRLRFTSSRRAVKLCQALAFGVVGVSGLFVNTLLMWLFVSKGHVHYLPAAALATQGSTLWNFLWTDRTVYRGPKRRSLPDRTVRFFLLNNAALLARLPIMALLVEVLAMQYLVANVLTLFLLFLTRFLASDQLIFSRGTA
jgi:putative flippase GtrA